MNCDYLSKQRTTILKGLLALMVLLHHTYQKALIGSSVAIFDFTMRSLGYFCVSCFLFLSGYGLMTRFLNGGGYSADFLKKRVLPIYIINVLLVIVYSVQKMVLLDGVDLENVLRTITFGGNVVDNGWYLQVIVLFYVVFFIAMNFTPNRVPLFCSLLIAAYVIIMIALNMPSHWYVSSLAFPAGLYWSRYKTTIDKFVFAHYYVAITIILIAFAISFVMLFVRPFSGGIFTAIMLSFSLLYGLFFTILVLITMMKVRISGGSLSYFSDCFLEIYVLQGLVFTFLRNSHWTMNNPYLFALGCLVFTILIAKTAHPLFQRIINMCK